MNIFFDTNIVLELLADRAKAAQVTEILRASSLNGWNKYLSAGSLFTIAFMTERILHQQGFVRPELTQRQRKIFLNLLKAFNIVSIDSEEFKDGAIDPAFSDLEDSFQYQCALEADCDILLTINVKDFKKAKQDFIQILSVDDFCKQYCSL